MTSYLKFQSINNISSKLKQILPKTLFARALLIIVTPLILMQAISTFVFFDRHWDTMTRRLSHTLAGDIAYIVDSITPVPEPEPLNEVIAKAANILHMELTYRPNEILAKHNNSYEWDRVRASLRQALNERVRRPFIINTAKLDRQIEIHVQLARGTLQINVHQKRIYSSTPYIFLMWMIGSSLVLFAIAIVFMKNQIRPIRRLAIAAHSFGIGRDSNDLKPSGATEVRQAAHAFRQMRERITRQFSQRTEMLAGVSHDLRTPLTRMKLQIEMLEKTSEIKELQEDVQDMERLIDGYLAFARGEGSENLTATDLSQLIIEVISLETRGGFSIKFVNQAPKLEPVIIRPQAIKRAITNLISNTKKHANTATIGLKKNGNQISIIVDDDGPGIKPEYREDVFRAFFRLEPSRNSETGGTGLGLTIARDMIHSHGGELTLTDAPIGGLRAVIELPV